ncbi:hypothetical protein T492DRAFT_842433 [Pavlovales sp. CCMP2436]|nr:hypothetical protein T492DRAFT_842433 [Pavlovales sp. CCMP2436]
MAAQTSATRAPLRHTCAALWSLHITGALASGDEQKRTLALGTNIGVQLRKLYKPEYYPVAKVLKVFDQHFGTARQNDLGLCAFGFEANPTHNARLETIESAFREAGHRMTIFRETAVGTSNSINTFFFNGNAFRDLGASTRVNFFLKSSTRRDLFALGRWLAGCGVVMKLDIEGSEESVLPWLRSCGKSAAILIREEAVARGERCAFQTFKMDDETYRFVNAVSGVKSIGRVLAAPLHLPLTKHN